MTFSYNSKRIALGIFILILFVQIAVILYWGGKKIGFHMDEIFTYLVSNGPWNWFSQDVWLTKQHFLNNLTVQPSERFSFLHVIMNHSKDVHPPFYYLIFHSVCSLFPDIFSKWSGLSINIIFFVLTQIIVLLISMRLTENRFIAILPCLLYGFSIGAHTTTMMIRMYTMLTFFCVLTLYVHIVLLGFIGNKKNTYLKYLFLVSMVYLLGIMTHYYFIIYGFFCSLLFEMYILYKKYYKLLIQYICIVGVSLPVSVLCYPAMLKHIFKGYRGKEAIKNAASGIVDDRFSKFYDLLNHDLLINVFVYTFIIIIAYKIISHFVVICVKNEDDGKRVIIDVYNKDIHVEYKIKKDVAILIFISIVSILFFCIVAKIAAYKTNRYIVCMYPAVSIVMVFISVNIFKSMFKNVYYIPVIILILISISGMHIRSDADWIFRDQKKLVNYIDKGAHSHMIVVYEKNKKWHCWALGQYFTKVKNVYISEDYSLSKIEMPKFNGVLFLGKKIPNDSIVRLNLNKSNHKKICSYSNFDVYQIFSDTHENQGN